jgi:hypothetical protein
MKKDIEFPEYKDLHLLAIPGESPDDLWEIMILNSGSAFLDNVIVSSNGYGQDESGQSIATSTLRHFFQHLDPQQSISVEKIDPKVFGLTNEYWISYYIGNSIYDKKFLFVPGSLVQENLVFIELLEKEAVLHA